MQRNLWQVLNFVFAIVALGLLSSATARAQTATYSGGSIYDLDPPSSQSTASGLLESLVASRQTGNMRKIGSYAPGGLYRNLGRPVGRLAIEIHTPRHQLLFLIHISPVGEYGPVILTDQIIHPPRVVHLVRRHTSDVDKTAAGIHPHMRLHPEVPLVSLP